MNELNKARLELHTTEGRLKYNLVIFGDHLAKRENYRSGLDGLEAVQYYLMQKHGWLPRDVRSMSDEDLRFAMSEELAGWTLPAEAL